MVFSSVIFLGLFLPVFLAVYFLTPNIRAKNVIILIFSLFFYAWGEPVWVLLMIMSGVVDYFDSLMIEKYRGKWQAKAALALSIAFDLGSLMVFKYSGFFVENINLLLRLSLPVPAFSLPLGISFYSFQTLSYTIDVYKRDTEAQRSFVDFMSYVTMFPQLVAGPIVRYADIAPMLKKREFSLEQFSEGVGRFALGLGKKVLLANAAGGVADFLLKDNISRLSMLSAWLGILMFTFQIYFDFGGYSDMAIGMGKMIGIEFKENFNYPYMSVSITDFWRRWHISLSTFFRDCLYIPLGGNRKFYIRNILIVWLLTGFWHGASWNFILWGLYFGLIILMEKYFIQKALNKLPRAVSHIYSLILIVLGWILFYFTSFRGMGMFFRAAFNFGNVSDFTFTSVAQGHVFLIIACIAASTPYPTRLARRLLSKVQALGYAHAAVNAALIIICFLMVLGQSYNPFLYFRF